MYSNPGEKINNIKIKMERTQAARSQEGEPIFTDICFLCFAPTTHMYTHTHSLSLTHTHTFTHTSISTYIFGEGGQVNEGHDSLFYAYMASG